MCIIVYLIKTQHDCRQDTELTRSDDQSITVSSGTDTFTITFCEVPRVSDNVERRFQRVRKPLANFNELKEGWPGPSGYFPFTIYDPQTEGNTEGEQKGSGSHFLAIQDDKDSGFKVKVRVGGVNVLQHTTQGNKTQDYFVVSEQKWVRGKQVDKNTARQFRVFCRGRERLSLRYQLRNNNIKKEIEIEITSRRLAQPTELWSYWPLPRMTLGDEDDLIPQPASPPPPPQPPPQPAYQAPPCHHAASSAPYYDAMTAPRANFQGPSSDDTGPSTPYGYMYTMLPPPPPPHALTASHGLAYDDPVPPTMCEQAIPLPVIPTYQPQASPPAVRLDRSGVMRRRAPTLPSSYPRPGELIHMRSLLGSLPSPPLLPGPQPNYQGLTCHDSTSSCPYDRGTMPTPQTDLQGPTSSDAGPMSPYAMIPVHVPPAMYHYRRRSRPLQPSRPHQPLCPLAPTESVMHMQDIMLDSFSSPPESAPPKPPSDQESIHSDPEEDMLPHQMVVGTGGLIEQIVHQDKHPGPERIDECTVTLKFKIVDPDYLKKETGVKKVGIPGGNYREVPNPPNGTFRGHAPVVTDPDGLRRDIRSPMEMEMTADTRDRNGQPPKQESSKVLPVDSGVGLVRDQEERDEEEDVREFQRLNKEAKSQPRGFMNDLRMKKESRKERKRGGVRIRMVVKPEEPKGERKSRWRTFVDAIRRILTLGR